MKKTIIIEAVLGAIAGAAIGYTYSNLKKLQKNINASNKMLTKWVRDIATDCTNTFTLSDLEDADKKDPMDPMVIYVYD